MIRKILIGLGILVLIGCIWSALSGEDEKTVQTEAMRDMPTEEEQQALEESQLPPETVAPSDMEDQFPENAEHD